MLRAIDISASALVAQRIRLNTTANNIANADTILDVDGSARPYVRKRVVFQVGLSDGTARQGVHVAAIEEDNPDDPNNPGADPFRLKYEPGSPFADARGYVRYPNVDLMKELVNAIEASRAYEANLQAIEAAKAMDAVAARLLE
jgi:flagellar basal-body rod protein FlgC